jgi:hypothetical protein
MTHKSKLALIAALVAVSATSPAFAQSFNPRDGTGNELPLQYQSDGGRNAWVVAPQNDQVAARQSNSDKVAVRQNSSEKIASHQRNLHAFAMVRQHKLFE